MDLNINFSSRVKINLKICTIEMLAIYKGLEMGIENNLEKIVTITGSASALWKIASRRIQNIDYITTSIRKLANEYNWYNHVAFLWIPGHKGVQENKIADKLARIKVGILKYHTNAKVDKDMKLCLAYNYFRISVRTETET